MITARNLNMLHTPPLNFTLAPGLTHGLVGANGVGKTTLLRMIAGQFPSEGLEVFGSSPFDNVSVMDRCVLMGIDNPLPTGWNLKKVFALGRARWSTWNQGRADELVERFELPLKNYSGLSRGQKSAAGFIFAVASGCELMLLDEPYLGLDVERRQLFLDVLREEHGRTIVVSTHHLGEVEGHLDSILLLADAPLVGAVDELTGAIVELSGAAADVDRTLGRLNLPVLERVAGPLGDRAIVDARPDLGEAVFDTARACGVRAAEVSLERAVLALGGK